MRRASVVVLAVACASIVSAGARSETIEEWITLGTRIHGGFGAFIPLGIRIGLDALDRLHLKPREVSVSYYDSDKSPCACFADGYTIPMSALAGLAKMNRELDPRGRYDAVMKADNLFDATELR